MNGLLRRTEGPVRRPDLVLDAIHSSPLVAAEDRRGRHHSAR